MLSENVENHGRAVNNLDLDDILEVSTLARGEFGVCNHGVGTRADYEFAKFFGFTFAEIGGRVWITAALQQPVEHS